MFIDFIVLGMTKERAWEVLFQIKEEGMDDTEFKDLIWQLENRDKIGVKKIKGWD